jgi:hypothetical protein
LKDGEQITCRDAAKPVDAAKGEVLSLLGKLGSPGGNAAGTSGGLAR